jgi:hypothetical protein
VSGENSMLETSIERVELLKKGIIGRKIEELYIINNNFKILGLPMIFELVEVKDPEINKFSGFE